MGTNTGAIRDCPYWIYSENSSELTELSNIELVSFSYSGSKPNSNLSLYRGHKDKIFVIKWNPFSSDQLVTVGIKHIKFWTQTGGGFTSKRGIFGNVAKQDTMLCVTYGKTAEMVYSGGTTGKVFVWEGTTLKEVIQAHQGTVMAMQTLEKVYNIVKFIDIFSEITEVNNIVEITIL